MRGLIVKAPIARFAQAISLALALLSATAEAQPASAPTKPIARTPDGKPNLAGTWQAGGVSITGEPGAPPLHPLPPTKYRPPRREPIPYQ